MASNCKTYLLSITPQVCISTEGLGSIYPTAYVGIQDFQAVTDCSIPGCTALEDCNPQAVNNYESRTGFPYANITTAGYYYINAGTGFDGAFDQDEVQPFLSLVNLPSDCPVVLEGPPYTLMPVTRLTETQTITSSLQGQTPSPAASPGAVTPSATSTDFAAPYYLATGTLDTNSFVQPLVSSSLPVPDGVNLPTGPVPPEFPPSLTAPTVLKAPSSVPHSSAMTAATLSVLAFGDLSITEFSRSQYAVDSRTLVAGGPAVTVSGMAISLAASAILVNGLTQAFPSATQSAIPPPLTIGSSTITANPLGQYIIGTQSLAPGGPAITVSGTTISLAQSASALIVNGITQTIPITPTPLPTYLQTPDPSLILGGTILTANSAGAYILGTQALVPGGPGIIISGTTVSLASSDAAIIVNGHTYTEETSPKTPTSYRVIATIDGETVSLNSAGVYEIGSQTIRPGGPAITIDGTPASLGTIGTTVDLLVAGSTEPLTFPTSVGGVEPSSTEGLGGVIFSGLVGLPLPSASGNTVVNSSGARARWEIDWWSFVLPSASVVLGGLLL